MSNLKQALINVAYAVHRELDDTSGEDTVKIKFHDGTASIEIEKRGNPSEQLQFEASTRKINRELNNQLEEVKEKSKPAQAALHEAEDIQARL